ncbi:hypothetical protein CHU98_g1075 [Xylaria longipes]|nr:hypothetical protein CHU98_g1075 [Xylaria longipes]
MPKPDLGWEEVLRYAAQYLGAHGPNSGLLLRAPITRHWYLSRLMVSISNVSTVAKVALVAVGAMMTPAEK